MCSLLKLTFQNALLLCWIYGTVTWKPLLDGICLFQLLYLCAAVSGRVLFLVHLHAIFFINLIIVNLRKSHTGCVINRTYLGCCMYADNLIILSAFLSGLKVMLMNCLHTCNQLSLSLNDNKSCCIYFGPRYNADVVDLMLDDDKITWNSLFKYLGIHFVNGKYIGVNIEPIRHHFFMSCNNILSHSSDLCDLV